jgi:hypothetical protein
LFQILLSTLIVMLQVAYFKCVDPARLEKRDKLDETKDDITVIEKTPSPKHTSQLKNWFNNKMASSTPKNNKKIKSRFSTKRRQVKNNNDTKIEMELDRIEKGLKQGAVPKIPIIPKPPSKQQQQQQQRKNGSADVRVLPGRAEETDVDVHAIETATP